MTHQDSNPRAALPLRSPAHADPSGLLRGAAIAGLCGLVALSAVVVKSAIVGGAGPVTLGSLAGVTETSSHPTPVFAAPAVSLTEVALSEVRDPLVRSVASEQPAAAVSVAPAPADESSRFAASANIRYFNGRAIRPARTIRMSVTAYSPDEKSCGPDARGITSSLHHVKTNGMKLVAADSKVLPLGSMISVPGYDAGNIVPVLDRGGAIKGNKLDVLFPTDAAARKWGVRKLDVVVWEYADNLPADDYRAIRDSRN